MSRRSSGSTAGRQTLFWLRWSWRDLKARWLQVLAIAMVIALGTGSYAGLSSVTRWRRASTDAAYASLRMYDIRVALAQGSLVSQGSLDTAVQNALSQSEIDAIEERLVTETQVNASQDGKTIIVPGLLYGAALDPRVNRIYPIEGRGLIASDEATSAVLLEHNFAKHYEMAPQGKIRLSGDREVPYVGHGSAPEYFFVTTERGGLMAEANFAAVFTSLATAQALSRHEGMVNEALLLLPPGADRNAIRQQLETGLRAGFPAGVEVTTRADDPTYRLNDRDIDGDQQIYDIFAVLIFAGAVGAAFNLSARLVEAQRREIGIAMILGLSPFKIAIRPMLVGLQIAVAGVLLGIGVGYVLGESMITLVRELQPLPRWETPFQFQVFARVALIGWLMPLAATAWPVYRAVSVTPIEATRPAYRSTKGGGLAPLFRWIKLPGNTLSQTPIRNLVRSPRRTLLTCMGIGASLAALIAFVGMIDSFLATTARGDQEINGRNPERVEIELVNFMPVASDPVQALLKSPVVGATEPGAMVRASVIKNRLEVGVQLQLINPESSVWSPTLTRGTFDRERPGIYLSEMAAADLGVDVGDDVMMRHPHANADGTIVLRETPLPVLGIHPHPFRFVAYVDADQWRLLGDVPLTNAITAMPANGRSLEEVKKVLFTNPAVASVREVGDTAAAIRDLLDEFVIVLRVVEAAMLLIALLIAFNSASIGIDERGREHATMFAFGVPVGTVMRLAVIENLLIGLISTATGVLAGWLLLQAIVATRIRDTMPDIYIQPTISAETLGLAVFLGVAMVAAAPLLIWRRLTRLNVPATLKVVE